MNTSTGLGLRMISVDGEEETTADGCFQKDSLRRAGVGGESLEIQGEQNRIRQHPTFGGTPHNAVL